MAAQEKKTPKEFYPDIKVKRDDKGGTYYDDVLVLPGVLVPAPEGTTAPVKLYTKDGKEYEFRSGYVDVDAGYYGVYFDPYSMIIGLILGAALLWGYLKYGSKRI